MHLPHHALRAIRVRTGIAIAAALLVAAGALYALGSSQFVPTHFGIETAMVMALLCALGGGLAAWKFLAMRPGLRRPLALAAGLVSLALGYEAFAAGIPAWYTFLLDHYGEQIMTVSHWRGASAWHCPGPDVAGAPFVQTVCLDPSEAPLSPPGTILILHGPVSPFGIDVEIVYQRD